MASDRPRLGFVEVCGSTGPEISRDQHHDDHGHHSSAVARDTLHHVNRLRGPVTIHVARFVFLDPAARTYFLDWTTAARDMVAALRIEAGRHPNDRALSDLVGELSTHSDEFATFWASQNVRFHRSGLKDIHHPAVGDLHLSFEAMDLPADPGLSLIVYSAEPGSSSEDGLRLLASWAATTNQPAHAATQPIAPTAQTPASNTPTA